MSAMVCSSFDAIRSLQDWLLTNGAQFAKMGSRQRESGEQDLVCRHETKTDERLLTLPRKLVMCSDLARESHIGVHIRKSGVRLQSEQTLLAAFMLSELENPFSFWGPFLQALPGTFDQVPIYFEDHFLEVLQGSRTLQAILDRKTLIREEYRKLCRAVPSFARHSLSRFQWAMTAVDTRCFHLPSRYDEHAVAIAPLMNMNHSGRAATAYWHYTEASDCIEIRADGTLSAGSQVVLANDAETQQEFFVRFGSLSPSKLDVEAKVEMHLDANDPARWEKAAFLRIRGGPKFTLSFTNYQGIDKVLTAIRSVTGNALATEARISHGNPRDLAGEATAFSLLSALCREALARFPRALTSSRKKEIEAAACNPADDRVRNLIRMRYLEQQVLHRVLAFATLMESRLASVSSPEAVRSAFTTESPVLQRWHFHWRDRFSTTAVGGSRR